MRERRQRLAAVAVAWMACAAVSMPATTATAHPGPRDHDAGAVLLDELLDVVGAVSAGRRFLDTYVDPDGRVVRRDQAGDTVSEGQAYALTIAAAIGDEATFRSVWGWTRRELGRDDGLFAWRWADGGVVDDEPATDADLLIAGALSVAADRFADRTFADAARTTGAAILDHETTMIDGHRILTAGPWATDAGVVNPSYAVVTVMSRLWEDGTMAWGDVAASSRLVIGELTRESPHLAPDWAVVSTGPDGRPRVTALGQPPRSGWDAVRIPVQLAADCDPAGRRLAARSWPFHLSRGVAAAVVHELDGTVVDPSDHAVAIVGAAGAASASGAHGSADVLLDRAAAHDREHPSYYGSAWIALGRLWLTTSLLGGCADR